jgi:DNA-binding transcriptional LysR family regulator
MQIGDRIGRGVKLQELNVFMTVVQSGTMLKAAERLNTVQPAVSRAIAQLESQLGVRLLDRSRQGVEPTGYGRALLDCAIAVFDELRQGIKNIDALTDPAVGEVRVCCGLHLGASFVSALFARLSRRYPRLVLHLSTENTTAALYRAVRERNVDLLIARRADSVADDRLAFEFLFDNSYFIVAGSQHRLARRRRIAPADLIDEAWVLPPPDSAPGAAAIRAFRDSGLAYPRATIFALPPDVRMSLLATGRFLTIFSTSALRLPSRRPELKVLPVTLPIPRVPNGIITLKNRTLSPAVQLFIEHAHTLAKQLTRENT